MKKCILLLTSFLSITVQAQDLHERKVCTTTPSKPFPECEEVGVQLDMLQEQFDACCLSLTDTCQTIRQTLRGLSCQQATGIDQGFINTATPQITQSGTYCLVENVSTVGNPLVIDANNVVVNLNGFTMSGGMSAIQATGHTTIKIIDGSIDGTTLAGIFFTDCASVQIKNIILTNTFVRAIRLETVNGFRLENCSLSNGNSGGPLSHFFVNNSLNGIVNCCSVCNSIGGNGFSFNGCKTIFCKELDISRNVDMDFGSVVLNSMNVRIVNSRANNNTNLSTGFTTGGFGPAFSSEVIWRECQVNNNFDNSFTSGFGTSNVNCLIDSCQFLDNERQPVIVGQGFSILGSRSSVVDCVAKNSTRGFTARSTVTGSLMKNNIALGNLTDGFLNTTTAGVGFFGNYAQGNGTNYSAGIGPNEVFDIPSAAFLTTGTPVTWNNIDAQP